MRTCCARRKGALGRLDSFEPITLEPPHAPDSRDALHHSPHTSCPQRFFRLNQSSATVKIRALLVVACCLLTAGCASLRRKREAERVYTQNTNSMFARAEAGGSIAKPSDEMRRRFDALFPRSGEQYGDEQKIVAPRLIFAPQPSYPLRAKRVPGEERVWVGVVVGVDGTVNDAKSLYDSNDPFSEAAVKAVKRWKFEPFMVDGQPKKFRLIVPIRFVLLRSRVVKAPVPSKW